jgi:hypothetical protein
VQPSPEKSRPPIFSQYILQGRWYEGVQPVQKKLLDDFMEKYHLQDQDWRKQILYLSQGKQPGFPFARE